MALDRVILLDENTANRIAAGEVVERPASAVKELVENAIDAGATQIVVALEEGGKQRLTVADNGCGMTRSDAILALQRHATSKIRSSDDLFAIKSLGFRGEALPSIASVSRLTLTTKPHDEESGTHLFVYGGDLETVEDIAARDGTTIRVEELFFNTPARLKFLKSTPTEVSRAVSVVGELAAAYPGTSFRLLHGKQEIFATPGTGDTLAALSVIWGRDVARHLIPISHDGGGIAVTGFITTPEVFKAGRSHELFYVNRRPIKSRLLGHALEDAFRSLTPDAKYPIGAIFVEISPELVDVNVHPTKTEVKFTRDGELHHAVSQAVKDGLLTYGIVPQARMSAFTNPFPPTPEGSGIGSSGGSGAGSSVFHSPANAVGLHPSLLTTPAMPASFVPSWQTGPPLEAGVAPFPPSDDASAGSESDREFFAQPALAADAEGTPVSGESLAELETLRVPAPPAPFSEQLREFRIIGQARNTYIVALTPGGIAVIDQHIAHERVLYERLTKRRFAGGIPVQRLAVPLTLTLNRREALLLAEQCEHFAQAGWEIAPFGRESFVVRAIPAMLVRKPYEQILRDMIDDLVNQTVSRRLLVQQEHVTITNACKMSVKAGDPLTLEEMQGLLDQLAETDNPFVCPHGRPIVVTIGFDDLDKLFKR